MKYPIDAITKQKVYRVSQDYRYPRRAYPGARVGKVRTDRQEAELNLIYVWKGTGKSSRFSDGKWPVLYTARQKVTSYVEVGYNLQRMFLPAKKPGIELKIPHICYSLTIKGQERDYMHCKKDFPKLCDSTIGGYKRCQELALEALRNGVSFLRVPSARRVGKDCFPVLTQISASRPKSISTIRIGLVDEMDFIFVYTNHRCTRYAVCRKY